MIMTTLKDKMKSLADALMDDADRAYETGDEVKFFNALTRLKNGSEALLNLAQTADILANFEEQECHTKP